MKESRVVIMLTYENIAKLQSTGRNKVFKTLLSEFIKELEDKKELIIDVKVTIKKRELKAYTTIIDKEDYKKIRELSKLNGVSLATFYNYIALKYLGV